MDASRGSRPGAGGLGPDWRVLYLNRRQAQKVRMLVLLFVLGTIVPLGWVWSRVSSADPVSFDGTAGGLGLAAFGAVALVGMLVYCRIYVVGIARNADAVEVATLRLRGWRLQRHPPADISLGARHDDSGESDNSTQGDAVRAPWITLWARGRRLPYVVDLQAETLDVPSIMALGRKG